MRISDWSSDVCSSDLHDRRYGLTHAGAYHGNGFAVVEGFDGLAFRPFVTNDVGVQEVRMRQVDEVLKTDRRGAIETNCRGHVAWKPAIGRQEGKADRRSVVEGRSGSVGVDPGGRRRIKKKNKKN